MSTLDLAEEIVTAASEPPKKGKASWRPAARMALHEKRDGLEYRWCDSDPATMQRHEANGWRPASAIHGSHASNGEKQSTSVTEYRGMVLCALPREEFKEHRGYYEGLTKKQLSGIKDRLRSENAKAAPATPAKLHGSIVID